MADSKKKTFQIDLSHPGAIPALRAYAKAETNKEVQFEILDLVDDLKHEQAKAARRAVAAAPAPAPAPAKTVALASTAQNATPQTTSQSVGREVNDAEEDSAFALPEDADGSTPIPAA